MTALQVAVLLNVVAVLFVVALTIEVGRYFHSSQQRYWLWAHVWEAALIACDLPHQLYGLPLTTPQVAGASLFAGLSLWNYIQLGLALRGPAWPAWTQPLLALGGLTSALGLRLAGANTYDALTPVLIALLVCLVWLGWRFVTESRRSVRNMLWLGLPFWIRAGSAPLITLVGNTPYAWTNYALGVLLHLTTGAGMAMFLMREGIRALEDEHKHLQKTNRIQNEFMHAMSHQLRTPLTVIAQSAHAMVPMNSPALREEIGDVLQRQVKHLDSLVSTILDFAKLESGTYPVVREHEDLGLYLTSWIGAFKLCAEQDGKTVMLDVTDDELKLDHDPVLLRLALENLVTNAVKHTPAGTSICVKAWKEGSRVRISVTDNGPGVPADLQDRVFERFLPTLAKDHRPGGGVGLGLAFVKVVVERYHHGRVWLDTAHTPGAAFHIALPTHAVTPASAQR
jgi:signal transduction histidine kinase